MKAEPTLNEMCEYIDSNRPPGYGHSLTSYSQLQECEMFIHTANKRMIRTHFKKLSDSTEFLFNYYFAVNNK